MCLIFVPCIAGLCIENQHCALSFVNIIITNSRYDRFCFTMLFTYCVFLVVINCGLHPFCIF
jgi:hypothetical protein